MGLRVENQVNYSIHNERIEIYNPEESYNNLKRYDHFTRFHYANQMPKPDRSKRRRNEKTPAEANPSPSRTPKRSKRLVQLKEAPSETLPPSSPVSRASHASKFRHHPFPSTHLPTVPQQSLPLHYNSHPNRSLHSPTQLRTTKPRYHPLPPAHLPTGSNWFPGKPSSTLQLSPRQIPTRTNPGLREHKTEPTPTLPTSPTKPQAPNPVRVTASRTDTYRSLTQDHQFESTHNRHPSQRYLPSQKATNPLKN